MMVTLYIYWYRTKAFERGSNISKLYAEKKKSIILLVGIFICTWRFKLQLMDKYTIAEINEIVRKWLLKTDTKQNQKYLMKYLEKMMRLRPWLV